MRRRQFITLLGGAAAWPLAVRAQQAKAPPRLGFLSAGSAATRTTASQIADIKEGLRQNGLIDGRDYVLDARYASGHYERFPDLAHELVQAGVSVILVNTIAAARAAQAVTPPLPVVMLTINDPVGTRLVASLAHPGGYTRTSQRSFWNCSEPSFRAPRPSLCFSTRQIRAIRPCWPICKRRQARWA